MTDLRQYENNFLVGKINQQTNTDDQKSLSYVAYTKM